MADDWDITALCIYIVITIISIYITVTAPTSGRGGGGGGWKGAGGGRSQACHKCGEEGHMSGDCPKEGGGSGCFKCGEDGHMSRDCPNGGSGGGGRGSHACHKCGEEGHMSRECPSGGGGGGDGRGCFECKINNVQKELLVSVETNQTRSQEAEDSIKPRLDQERAIFDQDYREMEERTEEAKREPERLREEQGNSSRNKIETVRGHSRNASNVSTLSGTSELIPDPEDVIVQQDGLVIGSASLIEVQEAMQTSRKSERSETLPIVHKKDDLGIFKFNMGDEKQIARNLVYELKPCVASTLLPGLPAYIIFMCVRHADFSNSDEKIRSFLTTIINAIRRVIKKRYEDLGTVIVWLVNTCRLLHHLKQYSGEKSFQEENTPKQNYQCLRNFDLSEYRRVLSDIAVWIYQAVIMHMEKRVEQFIVPAVLEHEAISGLSSHKQPVGQGGRARSGSTRDATSPVDPQEAFALLRELTMYHQALQQYGVDPPLVAQAFRQVFYYICACALNNLLSRKEMCHWSKGIQIRYNIAHLEQWVRDQQFHGQDASASITDTLQPILQAAQLLQARKSDDDVANICAMCSRLTSAQIIQILQFYTPADELEGSTPKTFIFKVQKELQNRTDPQSQGKLMMNTKFAFSVRFPFSPSSVKLEDIDVPDVLNLPMLTKDKE